MLFWRKDKNGIPESGRATEPHAPTPDAELVRAARRGDKRAFVEIVSRHQAMVCGIALGILGDFAASEDAGQEAFLTAWRKFHELREPERLRAWLAQIARNAALGHLRRQRGHEPLEDALILHDESRAPDEAAACEDEAALVRAFLAKLPETYRLPLVLFYRDGQSVHDVAETLGISEDAVKQRLARGREMLRDRMSGMVESVLTRTSPTAVFTMTIAVAIGALAAPAAMAGTAFAATSVAASSVSASSATSSSLLTTMSTSKTFLAATALIAVAFVPVGYHISGSHQVAAETKLALQIETNALPSAQPSAPRFENSALFAEWRALHEKHGTNAAAMPALYSAIADLKDPFRRRAFRAALIAEWVQLDAPGGLKFYLGKGPDNDQRRQFIEEWLALNPRAAVDALLASDTGWENTARVCLPEIARRLPSRVAEVVARLPKAESYWDTNVRDAFAIVAAGDLAGARKSAEAMTGANREQALAGVAQYWGRSDFAAVAAWTKSLPDGTDRDEIIRVALVGRAAVDPVGALQAAGSVPSGGRQTYANSSTGARVLVEAAKSDFEATVTWLTTHPGRFAREDLLGLSQVVTERLNADALGFLGTYADSGSLLSLVPAIESALLNSASGQRELVWEWLQTQPANDATKRLKEHVISSSAWQDPELALQLVNDLPRNAEGDAQVKELARCLFNGGNRLHRFDSLYPEVPERLRQPLVEQAFSCLSASYLGDPHQWINRLSLLPETSRANGIESIARAWATQTPEEAMGWVTSLPTGDARTGGVAAIVSAWAAKDAHGAGEWIRALPAGAERDRSSESFAGAIANKFPREAWDWVLAISDNLGRDRAAAQVVKVMAERDPATTRQWIESGPFPAETKTTLLAALPRSRK